MGGHDIALLIRLRNVWHPSHACVHAYREARTRGGGANFFQIIDNGFQLACVTVSSSPQRHTESVLVVSANSVVKQGMLVHRRK